MFYVNCSESLNHTSGHTVYTICCLQWLFFVDNGLRWSNNCLNSLQDKLSIRINIPYVLQQPASKPFYHLYYLEIIEVSMHMDENGKRWQKNHHLLFHYLHRQIRYELYTSIMTYYVPSYTYILRTWPLFTVTWAIGTFIACYSSIFLTKFYRFMYSPLNFTGRFSSKQLIIVDYYFFLLLFFVIPVLSLSVNCQWKPVHN